MISIKKIITFFLSFLIIFNTCCTPYIYAAPTDPQADAVANRQAGFLNFYQSSDSSLLSMDVLSAQEYYTLGVFASNYFEPGLTRLSDITSVDTEASGFYSNFVSALGKSSDDAFKTKMTEILNIIGLDIVNALESGDCTLIDTSNSGKTVTGNDFLNAMVSGINLETGELSTKTLSFKDSRGTKVAFDFSSPVIRAAFITAAAYNPQLFTSSNGIESLELLFIDPMGNVWGADATPSGNEDTLKNTTNYKKMVEALGAENFYLILPACLNPLTFSTNTTNYNDLRMPLMNRYVLGSLVDKGFFEKNGGYSFQEEMVPFYNLLSSFNTGSFTSSKQGLNVFGVNSLSNSLLNSGNSDKSKNSGIFEASNFNKTKTGQSLANFVFNPDLISVNSSVSNGVGKYGTNSYIVFSPNLDLVHLENDKQITKSSLENKNIDLATGIINTKMKFSVTFGHGTSEKEAKLTKHLKLVGYLFSPVALDLNHISMNFYLNTASGIDDSQGAMEGMAASLYNAADVVASKMGMQGFSLFMNYESPNFYDLDDGKYKGFLPDNTIHSKLVETLYTHTQGSHLNDSVYKEIKKGNFTEAINDANVLTIFNNYYNGNFTDESIISWGVSDNVVYSKMADDGTTRMYQVSYKPENIITMGSQYDNVFDEAFGRTLGLGDNFIRQAFSLKNPSEIDSKTTNYHSYYMPRYLMTFYGYSIFTPSDSVLQACNSTRKGAVEGKTLLGSTESVNTNIIPSDFNGNGNFAMGVYFGYMIDMMGISKCDESGLEFSGFNPEFLPHCPISAKGANLGLSADQLNGDNPGIINSEDLSFENKQKDLINRIYGLTNDTNNDYRNSLIKSILEGFFLTIHRTITGTWGSTLDTVTTGSSNTYQSVTGYIYTPTLEELSFTATMMNNYIKIYIFSMIVVLFLLILMVLLNMRTWQQGLITAVVMSVALLFPYILISNTISISNKISDTIYSDRFDFWAMSEHQQRETSLIGSSTMSEKDKLLTITNATADLTYTGNAGVKVKWMSPKKVDMFNTLYSDNSLSEAFITNTQIFKWLFNSFIYDSEFVDTDVYGSYLYRPYNSIAVEADAYYTWGQSIVGQSAYGDSSSVSYSGYSYTGVPSALQNSLSKLSEVDKGQNFIAGYARIDNEYYSYGNSKFNLSNRIKDINYVRGIKNPSALKDSDFISTWGLLSEEVSERMNGVADIVDIEATGRYSDSGVVSNLPSISDATYFDGKDIRSTSKAIYLKNTESPYYYFYSVLKYRYGGDFSGDGDFNKQLLDTSNFKIVRDDLSYLDTNRQINGAYKDFLDIEGLFTYIVPYLKLSNNYVIAWQDVNGSEIEQFNFEYNVKVDDAGDGTTSEEIEYTGSTGVDDVYRKAVEKKNAMNKVWNMYSPWVDSLYALDAFNEKVSIGGSKVIIGDSLSPSSYLEAGRPMIFSEADMIIKGYSYKDLTDVERRIQSVLEKTYEDFLYLVNYYDLDEEVLLSAAAMYATFNFNSEFSKDNFLGESVMLYPQGFELKNFNYDAFMRLALLNSTGENIFDTEDLYSRVLSKTSIFTGILLILCDFIACIAIPMFKFVIIVALLFLGLLVCIACVVNPPDKIFQAISQSLLLPTVIFMLLNIVFAWGMSLIVGEGLTAYVGSKTVNFATNDPTVTMLLMGLMGVAYLFFAWKIVKMIIDAYRKFGMTTVLSAIGVVSTAIASGAGGIMKGAGKLLGGGVSMGIGAATAEKGHRLAGAFEGSQLGTRGVINRRIQDRRYKDMMAGGQNAGLPSSSQVTSDIDKKAQAHSEEVKVDTTKVPETKASPSKDAIKSTVKEVGKQAGEYADKLGKRASNMVNSAGKKVDGFVNADWDSKIESSSDVHGGYKSGADAKMTKLDRFMAKGASVAAHATDIWGETKYRTAKLGCSLRDAYSDTRVKVSRGVDSTVYGARRVAADVKAGVELAPDAIKAGVNTVGRNTKRVAGDLRAGAQLAGEAVRQAPKQGMRYLKGGLDTFRSDLAYHNNTSVQERNAARQNDLSVRREASAQKANSASREVAMRKVMRNRSVDTDV